MQIVIDIDEDLYDTIKNLEVFITTQRSGKRIINGSINAIKNGIRLPKGHGRLIDADAKIEIQSGTHLEVIVGKTKIEKHSIDELIKASNSEVPTIIEADKEVDL